MKQITAELVLSDKKVKVNIDDKNLIFLGSESISTGYTIKKVFETKKYIIVKEFSQWVGSRGIGYVAYIKGDLDVKEYLEKLYRRVINTTANSLLQ